MFGEDGVQERAQRKVFRATSSGVVKEKMHDVDGDVF
jgi:hypothetical protein